MAPTGPTRHLRHALDKVVALIAFVVALPVLAGAAVAIRVRSRGPVWSTETRIGTWGRTFQMVTFRAGWPATPSREPGREASRPPAGRSVLGRAVGRLPQLVNVLRGDMSLVGPPPPRPEELTRALRVRPGVVTLRTRPGGPSRGTRQGGAMAANH